MKKLFISVTLSFAILIAGCSNSIPTSPWTTEYRDIGNKFGMGCAEIGQKIYMFSGYEVSYHSGLDWGTFIFLFSLIFLFGGPHGNPPAQITHPDKEIKFFDTKTDNETEKNIVLNYIPEPIYDFGCVSLGSKIYLFGGTKVVDRTQGDTLYQVSNVYEYSPAENILITKTPMNVPRTGAGYTVLNDKIYVAGGMGENKQLLASLEVYDPITNSWTLKTDMPTKRAELSCSAINGKIYAIGGCSNDTIPLNTVEIYDPATDKWKTVAPMLVPSFDISSAVRDGKIFVFGAGTAHSEVLKYDPDTDDWSLQCKMLSPRRDTKAITVNNQIYVIGGYPEVKWEEIHSDPYSIEIFSP